MIFRLCFVFKIDALCLDWIALLEFCTDKYLITNSISAHRPFSFFTKLRDLFAHHKNCFIFASYFSSFRLFINIFIKAVLYKNFFWCLPVYSIFFFLWNQWGGFNKICTHNTYTHTHRYYRRVYPPRKIGIK